jgi:hypothetical protein
LAAGVGARVGQRFHRYRTGFSVVTRRNISSTADGRLDRRQSPATNEVLVLMWGEFVIRLHYERRLGTDMWRRSIRLHY